MENQFSASELDVSNISALSNTKEVTDTKKSKTSILVLVIMVIFTVFFVFLSVYQFGGNINVEKMHTVSSYNNQVKQMAK